LLRNFMADTGNQIVLGTFVATFIYCLLVLRTVRRDGDTEFVPYISVTTGLLLGLVSLIVLIYFFHHMALSLQAPYVIGQVAGDLFSTIERLYPAAGTEQDRSRPGKPDVPSDFDDQAQVVRAEANGYIQAIDEEDLINIAGDREMVLKLPVRPGDFIIKGMALVCALPRDRLDDETAHRLRSNFILGKQRTYTQDVEYGVEQLVEVAERALSPGINATFTAITCIDWLGAALAELFRRDFPSPYRLDSQGNLRVWFERPLTVDGVVDAAFNQIRQSARDNVAVHIRLLEKIAALRALTRDPHALAALDRHARMIEDASGSQLLQRDDQNDVRQRYLQATEQDRQQK
jgi:uncharacterized membrane protein